MGMGVTKHFKIVKIENKNNKGRALTSPLSLAIYSVLGGKDWG